MSSKQFVFLLLLISSCAVAQPEKKNFAYLELGGTAVLYSINYDRTVAKGDGFKLNARMGFATLLREEPYIIPLEITGSLGKNNRFFEFGPGYSLTKGRDDGLGSVRLGYRVEMEKSIFRAAFILFPSIASSGDTVETLPWVGFSYGLRF